MNTTTTTSLNDDKARTIETNFTSSVLAENTTKIDFPQGCQFSPDGLCVLTSQCNRLELFNTQTTTTTAAAASNISNSTQSNSSHTPWSPVLTCCQGGDTVRSYDWYPHMNSADPSTCCFAGVSKGQPVHLYDAYTGAIRATYRPYNALDEMESPAVVSFVENGSRLAMGGFRTDRMIHLFDLNRPGRDAAAVFKLGKTRRSKDGQKGLVSALASSSSLNVLAVGTYSPGSIYIYDLRAQPTEVAEIRVTGVRVVGHGSKSHCSSSRKRKHFVGNGDEDDDDSSRLDFSAAKAKWYQGRTRGGVMQLQFASDCQSLYSLSRRGNAVLKWDIRKLTSSNFCPGIDSYATINDTNQRINFALSSGEGDKDEQLLWVGGQDNCVRVYDQNKNSTDDKSIAKLQVGDGKSKEQRVVNGVSVTKLGSQLMLVTSSGSRRFPSEEDWDLDDPHLNCRTTEGGMLQLMDVNLKHSCLDSEE